MREPTTIQIVRDLASVHGVQHKNRFFRKIVEQATGRPCFSTQITLAIGPEAVRMTSDDESVQNALDNLVSTCGDYNLAVALLRNHGSKSRKAKRSGKTKPKEKKQIPRDRFRKTVNAR